MPEQASVLVVDDEPSVGETLSSLLTQAGYESRYVVSAAAALTAVERGCFNCVISDYRMPKMNGMELLAALKQRDPALPVIMLTAHDTVPLVVEAMRLGVADFLTKPFDRDELIYAVQKAAQLAARAQASPPKHPSSGDMIGSSAIMAECTSRLARAAKSQATVLLQGESGTGKELAARAIHSQSARKNGPFIAVNCGAIPENLIETELFGHKKGAFTTAVSNKPGRVALAEGGTLFLDEIGDVPESFQVKLLRLLQEKEYTPVGGVREVKPDVRFVTATHRDLEDRVKHGKFRQDLFFRLNVLTVSLPPLRDRGADIREIAREFLAELGPANGRPELSFTDEALEAMTHYSFPGNVRELRNLVERLVVWSDTNVLGPSEVARELPSSAGVHADDGEDLGDTLNRKLRAIKKEHALEALERTGGNITQAATLLNIARRTMHNWMEELGIRDGKCGGDGESGSVDG